MDVEVRANKTAWNLVLLGTTSGAAAVAFVVWQEVWLAVIVGALTGSAVSGFGALLNGQVSWAAALNWTIAIALAVGFGMLSYTTFGLQWLAIVIALVLAGILGAVLSIFVWVINPTPVDLDAMNV